MDLEPTTVGYGIVFPCEDGLRIHNVELKEGFVKVQVDMVVELYKSFPLLVPTDDATTLEQATMSYIQWSKHGVILEEVKPT